MLASKALPLRWIGNSLPMPYKFTPAVDLATEVEWAKNRRLTPETYLDGLGEHEAPIPAELMQRVFRDYERRKEANGHVDFEDLLVMAIELYERDRDALGVVQARYRAFTVDEYQDVNLLQQTLLELWLGDRDDLCAVGDDYQAIYAFTGATPRHLLELPSTTRTPSSCASRRTTARRPRCSRSPIGSCRSSVGRRRRCARRVPPGPSRSRRRSGRCRTSST